MQQCTVEHISFSKPTSKLQPFVPNPIKAPVCTLADIKNRSFIPLQSLLQVRVPVKLCHNLIAQPVEYEVYRKVCQLKSKLGNFSLLSSLINLRYSFIFIMRLLLSKRDQIIGTTIKNKSISNNYKIIIILIKD